MRWFESAVWCAVALGCSSGAAGHRPVEPNPSEGPAAQPDADGARKAALDLERAGYAELAQKDCARAFESYAGALRIREGLLGPNHPLVAATLVGLAEAHRCGGNIGAAIPLFERAYRIESGAPDRLPQRVDIAKRLGRSLEKIGDPRRAAAVLHDAIVALQSERRRADRLYIELLVPLDATLRSLGDSASAEARWYGVPARDYCAPEPCNPVPPRSLSLNPESNSAPVRRGGKVSNAARVVASLRQTFRACYNAGLARDRRAFGYIEITIGVIADGSVKGVYGRRIGWLDDTTTRCVLDASMTRRFDPPAGGLAVIHVPVTFVRDTSATGPDDDSENSFMLLPLWI